MNPEILKRLNLLFQTPIDTKYSLETPLLLQKLLEYPDRNYPLIHVAGTNGKGSVCWKLVNVLQNKGYKVGLYTQPHLSTFRERIQINGVYISEEEASYYLSILFQKIDTGCTYPYSFFELLTFLAFYYFAEKQVDIAVIETGLGGRLDATNVVNPISSVITSIAFDHTHILGNTLEKIAKEKAGIIKTSIPVILGYHTPQKYLQKLAEGVDAPCFSVESQGGTVEEDNRLTAAMCLDVLKINYQKQWLESSPPCRFEVIQTDPVVILDVAHNPIALKQLLKRVTQEFPSKKIRLALSLSKYKNGSACVKEVQHLSPNIHQLYSPHSRLLTKEELSTLFQGIPSYEGGGDFNRALEVAYELAKKMNEVLVVCGSFFIMDRVRCFFGLTPTLSVEDLNRDFIQPAF